MAVNYKKLTAGDTMEYRLIRLESLRLYPDFFSADYEQQQALEKLRFEQIIADRPEDGFMVGAWVDNRLIGICGLVFQSSDFADSSEIIQMYVKPQFQRQQIGVGLIKEVLNEAVKTGLVKTITLVVVNENIAAKKLYLACGFDNFTQFVAGKEFDGVTVMRKKMQ